jgi:WASH complex subunit 7
MLRDNILMRYKLGYSIDDTMRPGLLMLINLSKKIEEIINSREIELMQDMMIKFKGLEVAKKMRAFYSRVKNAKNFTGQRFLKSAYQLNFVSMTHYPTHQRRMIMELCCNFLKFKGVLKEQEYAAFMDDVWVYHLLSNFTEHYKEALSCSFSYWIRDMMSDFLGLMSETDGEYFRLQIFLNSLEDSKDLLNNSIHLNSPTELIDEYRDLVVKFMNQKFMKRLSNKINDDLLVQAHHFYLVYQLAKPDPYKSYDGDMNILSKLRNVVVLNRIINIKELAELSLAEKFYNRAIYNQQNFHVYEVMRTLAKLKYNLDVGHSYIPAKSLEQGKTDILAILRKFIPFTNMFRYNMFNQSFIEVLGDGSRLKAISISHISDSIKTHGLGVINTCVEVVYKFIVLRINNFSQMMLDETLTSYLLREHRWLEKKKYKDGDVDQKYPLTRGEKFKKELSLASRREKKFDIVQTLRLLITSLGNALAFARILRTGSYNHLSKNIEFIPFIEEYECSFGDTAYVLNYSDTSKDCCKALDKMINLMRENFSKNADFLRVFFILTKFRSLSTSTKENYQARISSIFSTSTTWSLHSLSITSNLY